MNPTPDRILLVEDNPYDAALIQRAIAKARILNPVEVVDDGEKAIAYLTGQPPYDDREKCPLPVVTLLDLKLPKRSGFEVLEAVRSVPMVKRLPIVVLTSSGQTADVNRAYDLGANSYLVKPVGTDALVDLLKTIETYWMFSNKRPVVSED